MKRTLLAVALLSALIVSGSAAAGSSLAEIKPRGESADGALLFEWRKQTYTRAELEKALVAADAEQPIKQVRLIDPDMSPGHLAAVGKIAKAIGAKAFRLHNSRLSPIVVME